MPTFETLSLQEARLKTATGRQGQIVQQYADYVNKLEGNQAGRLRASSEEKITTLRRRLTTTAKLLGKTLVVKRMGDELYFWVEAPEDVKPKRRRRARSDQTAETS